MKNWSGRRHLKPPETWSSALEELDRKKFYLLQRLGPLLFVLKSLSGSSSDGVFKVWIGSPNHRCSCGGGGEANCIHINFVIIKILRIDPSNQLAWKTQLSEEDINLMLSSGSSGRKDHLDKHEFLKQGAAAANTRPNHTEEEAPLATRKALDQGEVCVICQEEISDLELLDNLLCYCKLGCGSNFHLGCVKILEAHARSQRKDASCPLCRAQIKAAFHSAKSSKRDVTPRTMPAVRCNHCRVTIHNQFARCAVCSGMNLCLRCFNSESLSKSSHDSSHSWLSAKATQYPAEWSVILPPAKNANRNNTSEDLLSLQSRDLQPSDYLLLLSLNSTQQIIPLYEHLTNALPDVLSCCQEKKCDYCTTNLSIDRTAKQFPCGHLVHKSCAVSIILSALSDSESEGTAASKIACPFCPSDQPILLFPALQREPKTKAVTKECQSKPKSSDAMALSLTPKKSSIAEALSIIGSNAVSKQIRANHQDEPLSAMSKNQDVKPSSRHTKHQERSKGRVSSIGRKPMTYLQSSNGSGADADVAKTLEIGGLGLQTLT